MSLETVPEEYEQSRSLYFSLLLRRAKARSDLLRKMYVEMQFVVENPEYVGYYVTLGVPIATTDRALVVKSAKRLVRANGHNKDKLAEILHAYRKINARMSG